MAVADIAETTARAIWILGARDTGATYNNTVGDDRYDQEEFIRAAIEAESEIVRVLAEAYHPAREPFLAWSAALAHGDVIPAHIGQVEGVQIEPYSAAGYIKVGIKTSRANIDLWRENHNNIFDAVDHSTNGSNLAGYFNLTNQTILFTGLNAQVKICTFIPDYTTPAHQVSNEFESLIVAGIIPKVYKDGVPPSLIQHYSREYQQGLMALRGGLNSAPEINVAQVVDD
jgi:hypothetical protein